MIASDTIGERMAGSGIRYWNLARVVAEQQPVTLATPNDPTLTVPPGVTIVAYGAGGATEDQRGRRLAELVTNHDVVVAQHLPYLYTDADVLSSRALVVDLYAPWILEKLEYARLDPQRGEPNRQDDVPILNRLLTLGDYFLCASARQRDFWLGSLAAAGRLDLAHAQADPDLRTLIDLVPFGLPDDKPVRTGPGPRSMLDGVAADDLVIIWNGGLWNWLDPLTAIRAMVGVIDRQPRARLVFMGTRSPGAQVAEMGVVDDAVALAAGLGLLNNHVFFNEWVPYDERQNWLLDADLALSLHLTTVEARFAFRTRMLDNLWCGLPSVVTEGDVFADLVVAEDIGEVAPPGDVQAVTDAILRTLDLDRGRTIRSHLSGLAARYTWGQVAEPLLQYCREPWRLSAHRETDAAATYLHRIERMYSETAEYARHLERTIAERDRSFARNASAALRPTNWARSRPNLGGLFRREKRG